jgi:hypothetical protein
VVDTVLDVAWAIVVTVVLCIPLGISVWALLDAVRRPEWAWVLAGRTRVYWMAGILLGTFVACAGVGISLWYLLKVRPLVAAAEEGRIAD